MVSDPARGHRGVHAGTEDYRGRGDCMPTVPVLGDRALIAICNDAAYAR